MSAGWWPTPWGDRSSTCCRSPWRFQGGGSPAGSCSEDLLVRAASGGCGQRDRHGAGRAGRSIWVPIPVERDIGRSGVIGAATALITWLTALSLVVVASAVVGAEVAPYLSRRD